MSKAANGSTAGPSLPKGGGALHGLGEKFSPDLQTGTGNFTVPIALPAGRHGFEPTLNLAYSTGQGNGPFGLGWSLTVPGISRKTSAGIPRYDDHTDTFVLSGAEDLVRIARDPNRYRPRTEGLFARITHVCDQFSDYWEVRSKDGIVSCYGSPRPDDAAEDWLDPAVVCDPAAPRRIFAWKLTATRDTFGNQILYEYERDRDVDGPHAWDQLYLRRIQYADYATDAGIRFLASVRFEYEGRLDAFSEYRSGFEVRTRRRCTRIETRTHAEEDRLVRTLSLGYLDQQEHPPLPANGVSLLHEIRVSGHDADAVEALPPLEFGYTRFDPQGRHFLHRAETDGPSRSLASPDLELVDLMGNGLPDILEMNGTVRYWRNRGDCRFDPPRDMPDAPAGFSLANRGVQLADADGDGRTDLLITTASLAGYFPLRFGGFWDRRSFRPYRQAPTFDLEDPEVRLVDLDGDGVVDAVRSGTRMECFFNDPLEGWNQTTWVERRRSLETFPDVNFSDPRVKWADMTGDGLLDIVLVHGRSVEYWPNRGRGNWGSRITMHRSPRLPESYDPRRLLAGDVDGDGAADLVYVDDRRITLWINQSGNGWSDPIVIRGTPSVRDIDAVRLVDLLGTGVAGLLWSRDVEELSHDSMFFLDFTGGSKPYLLDETNNHIGAITRIAYAPSTRFYLEDERLPATRWQTTLPFPVQVVHRVEVIDAWSGGKLTTEYAYHHGYWDGAEREFRGFGRVDRRDTETFTDFHTAGAHPQDRPFEAVPARTFSPPTELRTWFHLGPIGDESGDWTECDYRDEYWPGDPPALARSPSQIDMLTALPRPARRDALRSLRGRILRTELYALDGAERQDRPYTVTECLHGVREEAAPPPEDSDRGRIFFAHDLAARTTQWERGDDPLTQFVFTSAYDDNGQPCMNISIAVPRRRDYRTAADTAAPYPATQTLTTFAVADDDERHIADRVACVSIHEIDNDGTPPLLELKEAIETGAVERRLIEQSLHYYDGEAYAGLPFGRVGEYGALVRSDNLVLTDDVLLDATRSADDVDPADVPPYFQPDGDLVWTQEYPQACRDALPGLAGYTYRTGNEGSEYARGYFATVLQRRYDFQQADVDARGLVTATRDPLGHETTFEHDTFRLLPLSVVDPVGLTTGIENDYRVLQPRRITDANGNRTAVTFTALGLPASLAVMGKVDEAQGDADETPGTRFIYDFRAFVDRRQPISVQTIRHTHHATDGDASPADRDETLATIEYSDGFGRVLQMRAQAEDVRFGDPWFGGGVVSIDPTDEQPADVVGVARTADDRPNVLVSGWHIYDNKGQVVEKYEPFQSVGWEYAAPLDDQRGQKAIFFYDPRGEVIRTLNPDLSEQRLVLGVPGRIAAVDLSDPDRFEPTPWERYAYDANDNAGRTHPAASIGYSHHWDTPASSEIDALGRVIVRVERNGHDPDNDWYATRFRYDIRGNLLTVTDAQGRIAFRHVYDLCNRPLRTQNIDSGIHRTAVDAGGNTIEQRDGKGALLLRSYDALNRPVRVWARDDENGAVTLRERLEYGDGSGSQEEAERTANRSRNRLGKLHKHYDEAGLLTLESYDFKGNVLDKSRRVVSDGAMLGAVDGAADAGWRVEAFRIDWQPPEETALDEYADSILDATGYASSFTYDALNRITTLRYPLDVDGRRQLLRPRYNRAGALESVRLDDETYVDRIAYNAKGQRTLIAFGNGVMTRYAYEPTTFRLARMRTESFTTPSPYTYRPNGGVLQDLGYGSDLSGNVMAIGDRTPGSGIPNSLLGTEALDRVFSYDALNRLTAATGRESDSAPADSPWDPTPRPHDVNLTRAYVEEYTYDSLGNISRLAHRTGGAGFVRDFEMVPGSNRLASLTVGATAFDYEHDASGNLTQETTSRHFEWDHSDRLRVYRTQIAGAEPSVYAHCLYDAAGQRVKKLIRKQGGIVEATIYIDGVFEHHREARGEESHENSLLHVLDDQKRIAIVRIGAAFEDDRAPAVQYHLGDHLGSSNVVVDGGGGWVSREEYTPYGETSLGGYARKQYRFTGKERDEASGLTYHGARFFASWIGRWTSPDRGRSSTASPRPITNSYWYARGNPVRCFDPDGRDDRDHNQASFSERAAAFGRGLGQGLDQLFGRPGAPPDRGFFADIEDASFGESRADVIANMEASGRAYVKFFHASIQLAMAVDSGGIALAGLVRPPAVDPLPTPTGPGTAASPTNAARPFPPNVAVQDPLGPHGRPHIRPRGNPSATAHGNSLSSTRTQHAYIIEQINPHTGEVVRTIKYGISSEPVQHNVSPRAERQVPALGQQYDASLRTRVLEDAPNRAEIVQRERELVTDHMRSTGQVPPSNMRPAPFGLNPRTGPVGSNVRTPTPH